MGEDERDPCPACGSSNVIKSGKHYNRENKTQRYRCKVCGVSWSLGGYFKYRFPPYMIAAAIDYYRGGLSMESVTEKIKETFGYNLSSKTILNWIRKAGITPRSKGQPKNMETQAYREIIKMVVSVTLFHSSSLTPEKIIVLEEEEN